MLEFDQLALQIKEINAIEKRLQKHNKNSSGKGVEDHHPAG